MSKRLTTDAKIVLERAGYSCVVEGSEFIVTDLKTENTYSREIKDGTVSNAFVCEFLEAKGYNSFGYPEKKVK